MAFMTLGGVTVSIAGDVQEKRDLIGSISRAFSGAARYDLRRFKRTWKCKTVPLDTATYNALIAAIEVSTGTIALDGDLVANNPTQVYAIADSNDVVSLGSASVWDNSLRVVSLEIWEA